MELAAIKIDRDLKASLEKLCFPGESISRMLRRCMPALKVETRRQARAFAREKAAKE
ncbi:hypothetical protein LCGC14_2036220 [marine sediment metagenome]|uniref:Uncharacterized protein n=1 Tax=marine sediment metagenome TaxID=412755 RepID=A0A0F9ET68_9ZZZZ